MSYINKKLKIFLHDFPKGALFYVIVYVVNKNFRASGMFYYEVPFARLKL